MAPYFETAKSFADVPITGDGVDTATFLLASTDFVNMFDLLGGGVFAFVQNDLRTNIAGVRQRFDATPTQSGTLEKLVVNESTAGGSRHGTACLVRLVRGLWFTCEALRNMQQDKDMELHVCFRRSYDVILKHHHTFIVRSLVAVSHPFIVVRRVRSWGLTSPSPDTTPATIPTPTQTRRLTDVDVNVASGDGRAQQVAIRAVPNRQDFYTRLTQGGSHEKFDNELRRWLASLDGLVLRLKAFLSEGHYGTV